MSLTQNSPDSDLNAFTIKEDLIHSSLTQSTEVKCDCDAIFDDFETFLNLLTIFKPPVGQELFTVLIVIKSGSGFPLLCLGSHGEETEGEKSPVVSIVKVPQEDGIIAIIDANLARQDSPVKHKDSEGSCILLAY
ncbi:hypothetical protein RJZ57_004221 [Blastomyces gilchristii]